MRDNRKEDKLSFRLYYRTLKLEIKERCNFLKFFMYLRKDLIRDVFLVFLWMIFVKTVVMFVSV